MKLSKKINYDDLTYHYKDKNIGEINCLMILMMHLLFQKIVRDGKVTVIDQPWMKKKFKKRIIWAK